MPERHTYSERSTALVAAVGHAGTVLLLEADSGRIVWERALTDLPAGAPCDGQPVTVRVVNSIVIAASYEFCTSVRRRYAKSRHEIFN